MRIDLKMYDVVMDSQMFLPQVTENKRTDPGQNQPASNFLTLNGVGSGKSTRYGGDSTHPPPYFHCLKVN